MSMQTAEITTESSPIQVSPVATVFLPVLVDRFGEKPLEQIARMDGDELYDILIKQDGFEPPALEYELNRYVYDKLAALYTAMQEKGLLSRTVNVHVCIDPAHDSYYRSDPMYMTKLPGRGTFVIPIHASKGRVPREARIAIKTLNAKVVQDEDGRWQVSGPVHSNKEIVVSPPDYTGDRFFQLGIGGLLDLSGILDTVGQALERYEAAGVNDTVSEP